MTRRIRVTRRKSKTELVRLTNGPWDGSWIALDAHCDGNTAWINIGGKLGRYASGRWEGMGG